MASSFTWLDYFEQDKRKMLDVISLFSEKRLKISSTPILGVVANGIKG